MGRRGPPKMPAAVHARRGTYRPDRHGGGILIGKTPPKPADLSRSAAAEWDRLAGQMAEAGLLHDRFQAAFAAYCETVAEYWTHKRTLAREGFTITTTKGNLIQHPAVGMMGRCLDRLIKLARELGLTPASATGLQPGDREAVDPLDDLEQRRTARTSRTGSRRS